MAFMVDTDTTNEATLKHFCRICSKGFGCGRALGGHMRAHGIEEEDDDDSGSDRNDDPGSKRMYELRANPNNRLRSCRACENCGKEFGSWKSFLEHGKCVSDDGADSMVSSSPADSGGRSPGGCGNWSKRKRSFRAKVGIPARDHVQICPSSEEEDLANCLMMLSKAAATADPVDADPEESCASASRDELELRRAHVSFNHYNVSPISFRVPENNNKANNKGLFECKACKKVFNSHQALGGHRASHKKVKGCFAARTAPDDDGPIAAAPRDDPSRFLHSNAPSLTASASTSTKRKSKVHECSICHRIFSSGQALGGHKRCHWITSNASAPADASALAKFQHFQESIEQINHLAAVAHQALDLKLDLNLPANNNSVATEIFLQPWKAGSSKNDPVDDAILDDDNMVVDDQNNNKSINSSVIVEDEADSKVKLAKLSEGSSAWLQVGIGSTPGIAVGDVPLKDKN